ncbi:uncharacterized [Tachysurus ichikawai]
MNAQRCQWSKLANGILRNYRAPKGEKKTCDSAPEGILASDSWVNLLSESSSEEEDIIHPQNHLKGM